MKSATTADDKKIFPGAVKMFKSVCVASDKKVAFSCLHKGGQEVMLHREGRTDDPAIGIRRVMTGYDDCSDRTITV